MFIAPKFNRRRRAARGHRPRSQRAYRPAFELLEDRALLAVDLAWAIGFGGMPPGDSSAFEGASRLATDSAGNIYAAGHFGGTADFDPGAGVASITSVNFRDSFVAKYDPNGALIWARAVSDTGGSTGRGVAVDALGNVFLTGDFQGSVDLDPGPGVSMASSAGGDDIYVVKLDSNGDFLWGRIAGGSQNDQPTNAAVDSAGNVFVTGFYSGNVDFDPGAGASMLSGSHDVFIWNLDSSGNFVRAGALHGDAGENGNGIAVDSDGNTYISGDFQGSFIDVDPDPVDTHVLNSAGTQDGYLVKLDPNWNVVWAGQVGGPGGDVSNGNPAVHSDGSVYITGHFQGTADFAFGSVTETHIATGSLEAYVLKVDAGGDLQWVSSFASSPGSVTAGNGVSLDALGNVYSSGNFTGNPDFDPGAGSFVLNNSGSLDAYVVKLDNSGGFAWAISTDGPDEEQSAGAQVGLDGDVYFAGQFRATVDFDPSADDEFFLTANGPWDIYVAKLTQPQPANSAPVADDLAATVTEDGGVAITLSASDTETPPGALMFTITSLPSQGQLSSGGVPVQVGDTFLGAPTLVYEPGAAREGVGVDGFVYSVTDDGPNDPLSDEAMVTIDITKAVADGQVTIDAGGIVRVGGTSANNSILISRSLFGSKLQVRIDGQLVSNTIPLGSVQEIRAWGREGNDKITVLLVNAPALMHGGEGDDKLIGGLGSNLIFGGLGADWLVGGVRNDLLVGGDGNDIVLDAFGDDVLVGGNVSNQFTDEFLHDVLDQWAVSQSQNNRFENGLTDDAAVDSMFDSLGDDWFAVGAGDIAIDFNPFDDDLVTTV